VNDVLGVEAEVYFAVCGEDEFGGDFIVGGVGVSGIEAEGIAFAGSDELRAGDAEGGVGAGVAEVPGELNAGDFDLQGREGGSGVAGGGPEALGLDGQRREEDGEGGERKIFDATDVSGFGAAADEEAGEEDEVREDEEAEGDPEIEKEMVVERGTMGAGIEWERPREYRHRRVLRGEEHGHRIRILRVAREMWRP
jgi:hypothetical protein